MKEAIQMEIEITMLMHITDKIYTDIFTLGTYYVTCQQRSILANARSRTQPIELEKKPTLEINLTGKQILQTM